MQNRIEIHVENVLLDGLDIRKVRTLGFLDSSTCPQFQQCINRLIADGNYRFVVDFENVEYVSSAVLGVIMGFLQRVREHDGDFKIVRMSAKIRRIFDILGFSRILSIYDDEKKALADFRNPRPAPGTQTEIDGEGGDGNETQV